MDDYLKQALEIVKAQASVRIMSEEEITSMVKNLSHHLRNLEELPVEQEEPAALSISPAKSIKEKTITCLECGKSFKIITKKHLMTHNLDADSYREKWGIKKKGRIRVTGSLCCKKKKEKKKKKDTEVPIVVQ